MRLVALFFASSLFLAACYSGPTARPVTSESHADGVSVMLTEIDGNIFKFEVVNSSSTSLVILRDRIFLRGPDGVQRREMGGAGSVYTVPPGGHHAVNVKFALDGSRGSQVAVDFGDAIRAGERPLGIGPIEFAVVE